MIEKKASDYIPKPFVKIKHPEWCKNASIYQINTRQFTHEGTFNAAAAELPRLKELGTEIIWLMPIHEIGKKNRKGSLGSPYAVKDYYSVNSEFGTLDDFKNFVNQAHKIGLNVIIDWVANHTAWDCNLLSEHPEWYIKNWKGDYCPTPWCDWSDIIDLDYSQPGLRKYMTDVMKYWVKETNIDGFRCDVAGFVPLDFWENLRCELDEIKPVFMLAESEFRDLHAASFDMTYGWSWYDTLHRVTSGKSGLNDLLTYYSWNEKSYPRDGIRMLFVSNHDKNSWEGTEFEQFSDGLEATIVLSVLSEGMPLIYNGQESGNTKRLEFFERDPIAWRSHPLGYFYKSLLALKKENSALWNASWGAPMIQVTNDKPNQVFSFVRKNQNSKIFVVINFSNQSQTVNFHDNLYTGKYNEFFSKENVKFDNSTELSLKPWGYKIFLQN